MKECGEIMSKVDKVLKLQLPDGVTVCTPMNLHDVTTYVLIEQGDWFERDIEFVRAYVKPGMRCIDIGASFGIYTLTMAKRVGETGKVVAFEPTPETHEYLEIGIAANGFKNVEAFDMAIGAECGFAEIALCSINEGNHIVTEEYGNSHNFPTHTVDVVNLDEFLMPRYDWLAGVDFVKMDVEGYEQQVLEGGKEFFKAESPLVMFEVSMGGKLHLHLFDTFAAMGYQCYQYVPAIKCLVPATKGGVQNQERLLNCFACKPDKAQELERAGMLATMAVTPDSKRSDPRNLTPNERYGSLVAKWHTMCEKVRVKPTRFRMQRLVKLAEQLGFAKYAVSLLEKMNESISAEGGGEDHIRAFSHNLKQIERLCALSSFFTAPSSAQRIAFLRQNGQSDEEMDRRFVLIAKRFGDEALAAWCCA